MRVTTAFNRMLGLPEASVIGVEFGHDGVIVRVRLRRRRRVCSQCRQVGVLAIHDRRVKRWRHLDLGASRCIIECELRRLWCRSCGGPRLARHLGESHEVRVASPCRPPIVEQARQNSGPSASAS